MFSFSSSSGLYLLFAVLFLAVIVPLGGGPSNEGGGVHAGVVSLASSAFGSASAGGAGAIGGGAKLARTGALLHPRFHRPQLRHSHGNRNSPIHVQNFDPCCVVPDGRVRTQEDGPLEVTVGVYILDISEVDAVGQGFMMSGYYWVHYNACAPLPNGYEPYDTVFIENQNQAWAYVQSLDLGNTCYDENGNSYTCPTCDMPDIGDSYVDFQFSASLKLNFNFQHFPMDEQELIVAFEDLESDSTLLKFIPDPDSNIHPGLRVMGFELDSFILRSLEVVQQTNYGMFNETTPKQAYSRVEIGVKLKRSAIFFTMKILPPTLVTLLVAGIILFIDPYNVDTRLGSAIFSLLTMVFLEVGFYWYVPDTSKLTVVDWLYNWCYLLIVIVVFECVGIHYYLRIVNKIRMTAEVGANFLEDYEVNHKGAKHWFKKLMRPTLGHSGDQYDEIGASQDNDETEEEKIKRLRDEAKRIMHDKYRMARKVDYIMAIVVFVLSTVGTTVVIVAATYA